jgi:hypothetical protein
LEFLAFIGRVVSSCCHVASVDIEPFKGFSLIEEGLIDLKVLLLDALLREEEPGPGRIALDELLGEYFVDGEWTAVVLGGSEGTVE